MPCLSRKISNNRQAIIDVGISDGSLEGAGNIISYPALIDTGATSTCISKKVALELKLNPTGKVLMQSASHTIPTNLYMVDLTLPFGAMSNFHKGMVVTEISGSDTFQIIIGMDIITMGTLHLSFDGNFNFCL